MDRLEFPREGPPGWEKSNRSDRRAREEPPPLLDTSRLEREPFNDLGPLRIRARRSDQCELFWSEDLRPDGRRKG